MSFAGPYDPGNFWSGTIFAVLAFFGAIIGIVARPSYVTAISMIAVFVKVEFEAIQDASML
jgi:hypothetical protein